MTTTPTAVMDLSGATQLCAGADHACALDGGGALRCWGAGSRYQLGDRMMTDYSPRPVPVASVSGAVDELRCGEHRTCVRQGDAMRCWGRNDSGQIGDGTTEDRPSATAPAAALRALRITTGASHSCVIATTNVFCFGANADGQLGTGSTSTVERVPSRVDAASGASELAAGGRHTCAIRGADVLCWGAGARGQLGRGAIGSSATPEPAIDTGTPSVITMGAEHGCLLTDTGEIRCWGAGTSGQLGDGASTDRARPTPIAAIAP